MKFAVRVGTGIAVALVAVAALAGVAAAAPGGGHGSGRTVFVLTDGVAGNQVVAYDRLGDGRLKQAGTYSTGGNGGTLAGAVVDRTASQGALSYDAEAGLLLAVNPGSDSVAVFRVSGDRLTLTQIVPSGGSFPVSIASRDSRVIVLNARNGGSLQGYAIVDGRLAAIAGSARALGLDPLAVPEFTHTPGQVAFAPDGSQVIVTTKGNGSAIDVFSVDAVGNLSAAPVVNTVAGAVPFAVGFDDEQHLIVAEAGANALGSFALQANGSVTSLQTVATGQAATCWVARAGTFFYASNAGSGTISRFAAGPGGALTLLGATPTDKGTVDAAATPDGDYLYVQAGAAGIVDGFSIGDDGSLTPVGAVTVPDAVGAEGIVAL